MTSHLVETLDSLNAYNRDADVKKLVNRVPKEHKKQLAKARGVIQKVGDKALDTVRNNTFHYPSPKTNYSPTSDEQLRDVLDEIGKNLAYMHLDHRGEHSVVTLTFAQEVALGLAISNHSPNTRAKTSASASGTAADHAGPVPRIRQRQRQRRETVSSRTVVFCPRLGPAQGSQRAT